MYEAFFGFTSRPFAPAPHPDHWVPVESQERALTRICSCLLEGRGIAVLSGEAGLGKTLLSKTMSSRLGDEFTVVLLTTGNFHTRRALLQSILFEMGLPYVGLSEEEARLQLFEAAEELAEEKRGVALLIDEAHLIEGPLFRELRTLADHAPHGPALWRLALFGQLPLEEHLAEPDGLAVAERIGAHELLEPMTREESIHYLEQRITRAGGVLEGLFAPDALNLLIEACDGNPRCLNHLADHSLLLAYAAEEPQVSVMIVRDALIDLRGLPLRWKTSIGSEPSVDPADEDWETSPMDELADETEEDEEITDPRDQLADRGSSSRIVPVAPVHEHSRAEPLPTFTGQVLVMEVGVTAASSHESNPASQGPPVVVSESKLKEPETIEHSPETDHGATPVEELAIIDRYAQLDHLSHQVQSGATGTVPDWFFAVPDPFEHEQSQSMVATWNGSSDSVGSPSNLSNFLSHQTESTLRMPLSSAAESVFAEVQSLRAYGEESSRGVEERLKSAVQELSNHIETLLTDQPHDRSENGPNRPVTYDVVTPEFRPTRKFPSERQAGAQQHEQSPAAPNEAAPESGRFSHLFSRLRRLRQKTNAAKPTPRWFQ